MDGDCRSLAEGGRIDDIDVLVPKIALDVLEKVVITHPVELLVFPYAFLDKWVFT